MIAIKDYIRVCVNLCWWWWWSCIFFFSFPTLLIKWWPACVKQAKKPKKTTSLRWWTERWILLTCSFKRWVSSLFCGLNHYACRAHSSFALLHRHGNERCHTQTKYCNDWDNTELKQRCATLKFRLVALLSVCLKYEQNRGKIWNRCSLKASAHINENTLVRTFSSFSCWRWGLWYLENDASSSLQGHTLYFMVLGNGIQHLYMFAYVYISTYISPFSKDNCGWGGVNSHFCFLYSWRLHVAKKKPNFTVACRNPVRVVGTSVESWLSCVIFSYSSHWIVVHWKIFSTLWSALVSQFRGLNMGHVTCNMGLKTYISVCVLGRLVCFSYFLAHSVSLYKNHFFFLLRMNSVYLCWWVTADVQLSDHLHRWVRRQ